MNDILYSNQKAKEWLEKICSQRFNSKAKINITPDSIIISFRSFDYKFVINGYNSDFNKGIDGISYSTWDANTVGLQNPLGAPIPVIGLKDKAKELIKIEEDQSQVNFDFLGMVYFALARVEELGDYDTDRHQRFRFEDSHAYRFGYIERPYIDEWFNIFCQILYKKNLIKQIPKCEDKILLSHDVDRPAKYSFTNLMGFTKAFVKDILSRQFNDAFYLGFYRLLKPRSLIEKDPYNTFDYLMNISEESGLKSTFYFIAGNSSKTKDADYIISENEILSLIENIASRGHYIGVHPSYNSYLSEEIIESETLKLRQVFDQLDISQNFIKSRMHYLKFKHPYTYRYLSNAGIKQNSTMGFAEHVGFRAGTCWPYPVFDPINMIELPIEESPLIAMDVTLYGSSYMNIKDHRSIEDKLKQLYKTTSQVGGRFELLWHNSNLKGYKKLYKSFVSSIK
ncbi:MAG: hypothetical protein CMD35_03495 [Flavobacteriales bacterium]|nr:hypothetical protein [Flavobacteriales bacterium]